MTRVIVSLVAATILKRDRPDDHRSPGLDHRVRALSATRHQLSHYAIADKDLDSYGVVMNETHLQILRSDDWRAVLRDLAFPFAFDGVAIADLGDDVLEVGPGPGLATDLLLPELPSLTVLEIDPTLVAELGRRLGDEVAVVEGDATAMNFDDDRFSGVVSFTMLHHVPTVAAQDRLFAEVLRVLRPGGLFVANDSVASDDLAALHHSDTYNPIDPDTLPDRLRSAGFVDVDVDVNEFAFAVRARAPRAPTGILAGQSFVGFLPITDPGRAKAFYRDVLGLGVRSEDDFTVVLDAHGTPLRLTVVDAVPEPWGTTAGWSVLDVTETARELAAVGVTFEHFDGMDQDEDGVWKPPGGGAVAWFRDPDGNRLSVSTPSSSR